MQFIIKKLTEDLIITGIVNVHFLEYEKEFNTEKDKHPFYELVFVSNGVLNVSSEHFSGSIDKGKMILHRPNEFHSLASIKNTSATVVIVGFTCENLPDYLTDTPLALSENNVKILAETVKEGRNVFAPPYNVPVYNMKKNKNPIYGSEQMLKISLERFIISLIRETSNTVKNEDLNAKFNVNEIIDYLNDKYKEKITITELAFIFGTNRTTLCKEFKKATKLTINEYLSNKKLEVAKSKICEKNATFTEISNELNFESIHYFTRFFKKKTGLTPKEFRKINK